MGDFSGVSYDPSDPACWWTYRQCVTPKLAGLPPDIYNVPEPFTMGYGFDDGPNCSHNAFYDYLLSQNQKASMFAPSFLRKFCHDLPINSDVLCWQQRYELAT